VGRSKWPASPRPTTHAPHANVYWEPLTDVDVRHDDDDETGNISVAYPSKHVFHSSQLTAYINAYECCLMVDQLMEMDLDKVVQVQKDDILYVDHETNILPFMRDTKWSADADKPRAKWDDKIFTDNPLGSPEGAAMHF